ncbi:calmodulin-alpha-like [Ruditapes philippinarum]|uniref:calmodulin-alpha-like n=1 Tax=Ruditapes philippinarum TaxID=129788 RepID=UPI00295AC781|nr:calmodulin-alpha-like [Ruditapes philippinarum]
MGEQLTDEEILECKRSFAMYDRDGDGTISSRELGAVMRSMGYRPSDNELTDIFNEFDPDGHGEFSFPEFLSIMAKKLKEYEGEESLRLAFRVFDKDDNGMVTVSDFRYMMENLKVSVTEKEIEEMIKDADKNHNGYIPYNEFITWITGR